jgi:hypothetical protein
MKIGDRKTVYVERIYEHASFSVFPVFVFRTL